MTVILGRKGGGGGGIAAPFVGARVTYSANVSQASGSLLSFDTEQFDTHGFFDLAQPTRLTIPAGLAGVYLVQAGTDISGAYTGRLSMQLLASDKFDFIAGLTIPAGLVNPVGQVSSLYRAAAGVFLTAQVFYSPSPQSPSGNDLTYFSVAYLGAV